MLATAVPVTELFVLSQNNVKLFLCIKMLALQLPQLAAQLCLLQYLVACPYSICATAFSGHSQCQLAHFTPFEPCLCKTLLSTEAWIHLHGILGIRGHIRICCAALVFFPLLVNYFFLLSRSYAYSAHTHTHTFPYWSSSAQFVTTVCATAWLEVGVSKAARWASDLLFLDATSMWSGKLMRKS